MTNVKYYMMRLFTIQLTNVQYLTHFQLVYLTV